MEPIRIRLYGLFSLTRKRYVAQLVVALVLAAAVLIAWWFFRASVREQFQNTEDANALRFVAFWNVFPLVILAVAGLQLLEAFFVLRMFRRREAERSAQPPPRSASCQLAR